MCNCEIRKVLCANAWPTTYSLGVSLRLRFFILKIVKKIPPHSVVMSVKERKQGTCQLKHLSHWGCLEILVFFPCICFVYSFPLFHHIETIVFVSAYLDSFLLFPWGFGCDLFRQKKKVFQISVCLLTTLCIRSVSLVMRSPRLAFVYSQEEC